MSEHGTEVSYCVVRVFLEARRCVPAFINTALLFQRAPAPLKDANCIRSRAGVSPRPLQGMCLNYLTFHLQEEVAV